MYIIYLTHIHCWYCIYILGKKIATSSHPSDCCYPLSFVLVRVKMASLSLFPEIPELVPTVIGNITEKQNWHPRPLHCYCFPKHPLKVFFGAYEDCSKPIDWLHQRHNALPPHQGARGATPRRGKIEEKPTLWSVALWNILVQKCTIPRAMRHLAKKYRCDG